MGYVALRNMEVSGRQVKPGDLIPEVDTWKDPGPWIRRGWLACVSDGKESEFIEALKHDPQRAVRFMIPFGVRALRTAGRILRSQSGDGAETAVPLAPNPAPAATLAATSAKPQAPAAFKPASVPPKAKKDG